MAKKPQTREERLAAALRANLKRRKEDTRARERAGDSDGEKVQPERPNPAHKPR